MSKRRNITTMKTTKTLCDTFRNGCFDSCAMCAIDNLIGFFCLKYEKVLECREINGKLRAKKCEDCKNEDRA